MENLNNWIIATNDFIWTYILIALLICIGVYFTFKSKFVQFRNIREMFRLLGDGIASGNHKNSVSSFQAFCTATASRVGTGNLAGVATALALEDREPYSGCGLLHLSVLPLPSSNPR